jgi:large subunit ribosomal protein L6
MAKITKTKRKDIAESMVIPSGIDLKIDGRKIIATKDSKIVERFIDPSIECKIENSTLNLKVKKARRAEKRRLGTVMSHIKNVFEGFDKPYEYELEICHVHFPVTFTYDKAKSEFVVKNLLGERSPRVLKAILPEKIEVEIKAPVIKIKSYDLEAAGQNAANIEKLARIRNRDRNKFQDGIFITKKPGKHLL